MQLKCIENTYNGKYLHGYDATYINSDNQEKVYEIVTRTPVCIATELSNNEAEGVTMIIFDESHEHMLLQKEFRLAVNGIVVGSPSGLIDPGETVIEAAKRELKEETGLELVKWEILPASYSSVSITNEKVIPLIGVATGTFAKSSSVNEEIEAKWYTRQEVKEMLNESIFSGRTQIFAYMFANNLI